MSLHIEQWKVLELTCMAVESYMSKGLSPLDMPLNTLWQHLQSLDSMSIKLYIKSTGNNILSQSHMRQPDNHPRIMLLKIALQPLDHQHKIQKRYTKNQLNETSLNLHQSYSYFQLQIFVNVISNKM